MWRFAFLGLAFLGLTVSCTDGPSAPSENTDGLSLQFGDPPPPPLDGDVLFSSLSLASAGASARQQDCPIQGVFCVRARYFQNPTENLTENDEWLDYLPVAPLPNDIKRQLKEAGAACFDILTDMEFTCDVNSTAQGRLVEKNGIGDGKGLAYDVSEDGESVTTIALDQFDGLMNPLDCFSSGGFASCTTPPVFAEMWERAPDGTYTRDPVPVLGVFAFTGDYPGDF